MITRKHNIFNLLKKKKSILLLGPRGVGKTALIGQVIESIKSDNEIHYIHIDLLQGNDFARYIGNPSLLKQEVLEIESRFKSILVIIDEIQKVPALLDEAHSLIERFKNKVIFLFSGSSARKLKRGGANLLAGRALACNLYPLNQSELELSLTRALQFGTMPGCYLGNRDLDVITLETYVSTYLREEVLQESMVRRLDRFARFLDFAAQNNGQAINFTKLGKQLGITGKTVAEYYLILEDTLIVHGLSGWSESIRRQLLQSTKYYFFDCGVLNALNGYLRVEMRNGGVLFGNLFETFVINQLLAINHYNSLGYKFYYWRDKDGHEVDLILARNAFEPVVAIEIKSAESPTVADCPGFKWFSEDYPDISKICICNTPRSYLDGSIKFISWREIVDISKYL